VRPCSFVVGHLRFRGSCCPHLPGEEWQHRPMKRWYPTTTLHDVTIQKTSTWIFTVVKTSCLP